MASIKVVLYISKTLKQNGEHPIMLRIIKNRKVNYISLNESCSKDLWNKKENLPKTKHPLFKELTNKINKEKLKASRLLLNLDNNDKDYSSEQIRSQLKIEIGEKKTLFEYFDEVIKRLEKSNRIGYASIFQSTKNSISNFRKEKDMAFTDITPTFISKYEEDFYDRGVQMNSVFIPLRTLKTLLNYARKENLIKPEFDPFKEISFSKFRRIRTAKRAISKENIHSIIKLKIPQGTSLNHARNYFLFSYFTRGINFIDIANLKWENIINGRLNYVRKKTKENFTIGLLPPALKIIKYYKKTNAKSEFIFPILNENHKSAKSINYRVKKVLKQVNSDLKKIAESAKVKVKLTTYVARHSFATNMKRSGISTSLISESLGHESEKTTQIYLDSFENKILDEASKAIL